jgi:hypothetical protein
MTRQNMLITVDDLEKFKVELLFEIQKLLEATVGIPSKQWLKSIEVRKLLNISHCTLQNMRSSGKLPYTKIGGVFYYDVQDIQEMLRKNKINKSNLKAIEK